MATHIKNQPILVPRQEHCISRKNISKAALKVMYRLLDAGFTAFLVGGSVRDLLVGIQPKDFDVATNAHPNQIKQLFNRQARIIGKRFRLVHVQFGPEIIEVSTFRGQHPVDDESTMSEHASISDTGQILRDNIFGSIEDDALRRDFTINALYYTVDNFVIHDYVGGMSDLKKKRIRLIGDPNLRYREDPVRLLRAIRFAAKLGFNLDSATAKPIKNQADLLYSVPTARLFDETLKLLLSDCSFATFKQLIDYQLFEKIFPKTHPLLFKGDHAKYNYNFVIGALKNTENRLKNGKTVTPVFLFAVMLWPCVIESIRKSLPNEQPLMSHLHRSVTQELFAQHQVTTIPRRISKGVREIWEMQVKLHYRNRQRPFKLLAHPRFRAGYDFLLLREESGDMLDGLGQWWTDFQQANTETQKQLATEHKHPKSIQFSQIYKL